MATGDIHAGLQKLEALLRIIKYSGPVDYNGFSQGDPSAFLPILSFSLTIFSPPLNEQLMASGFELTGKTDLRFTEMLFRVLRDFFHYNPTLTKQQFLKCGFSQRKISFICDTINLVLQKNSHLQKKSKFKHSGTSKDRKEDRRPTTDAATASQLTFVLANRESPSRFLTMAKNVSPFSNCPKDVTAELTPTNDTEVLCDLSDVEGRLSAVEAQLQSLPVLHRLNILEKRLDELEKHRDTEKFSLQNEREIVNISKESWQNLMTRVLLLETKLELCKAQGIEVQPKRNLTHERSPL